MTPASPARSWITWAVILIVLTVVMRLLREDMDQAHAALLYLLVVLGASVGGGRAPGLVLACIAFLLIDYFFQPPYDLLEVSKVLDLTVLFTFLATAAVATELVAQAQAEAREARRRADEIAWLSRLGSETLNAPKAEDALAAIAHAFHRNLDVRECEIRQWTPHGLVPGASAGTPDPASAPRDQERMARVALSGRALAVRADGTELEGDRSGEISSVIFETPDAADLFVPLEGATRVVGVLRLSGAEAVVFDQAKRRFLVALAYYTALGVERVHLVAEAAHAEALREADRMKDALLATVSHDLRTPLTTIKALAQDAAIRGDEPARIIEQQADLLSRMVADVLDLSRIKGGVVQLTPELNTAEDLVGAALSLHGRDAAGRSIRPSLDMDSPALVGSFDFANSLRILNNLIDNALRYTPPGGVVEVSVRRDGGDLVFTVADRGPGVATAERERIFEPFYRPPDAIPDAGRSGLGLAIARQLAELQGGRVLYQAREGGGSLFHLLLPAADLDEASLAES